LDLIKGTTSTEKQLIIKKFGRLDMEEYINPRNNYVVAALDRFSRLLNIEEADKLLLTYDYHKKERKQIKSKYFKQESNFLEFFTYAYELNQKYPVYVYSPNISSIKNFKAIKTFNENDKKLLKGLLNNIQIIDGLYKVDNENLLHLFVKLSTRELHFSNFFFIESSSLIIGNYDMNFPIYCINELTMSSYEKQTSELELFIRR